MSISFCPSAIFRPGLGPALAALASGARSPAAGGRLLLGFHVDGVGVAGGEVIHDVFNRDESFAAVHAPGGQRFFARFGTASKQEVHVLAGDDQRVLFRFVFLGDEKDGIHNRLDVLFEVLLAVRLGSQADKSARGFRVLVLLGQLLTVGLADFNALCGVVCDCLSDLSDPVDPLAVVEHRSGLGAASIEFDQVQSVAGLAFIHTNGDVPMFVAFLNDTLFSDGAVTASGQHGGFGFVQRCVNEFDVGFVVRNTSLDQLYEFGKIFKKPST